MGRKKTVSIELSTEEKKQDHLNRHHIDRSLFVVPYNDGEAVRVVQILRAAGAPYLHVSRQNWGATLDAEWERIDWTPVTQKQVDRVVVMEMPGRQLNSAGQIELEQRIEGMGVALKVIDHHHYAWVNRFHSKSSLEQLCADIGWRMSPMDLAIAINDRSYIAGLKSLGLGKEEIGQVRRFDLLCQGNSANYIDKQLKAARAALPTLEGKKRFGIWVIDEPTLKLPYIMQEIALSHPKGFVCAFEYKSHKIGFSGTPLVVSELLKRDFKHWEKEIGRLIQYAGGDESFSKYWGLKVEHSSQKIPRSMADETLEFIGEVLAARSLKPD